MKLAVQKRKKNRFPWRHASICLLKCSLLLLENEHYRPRFPRYSSTFQFNKKCFHLFTLRAKNILIFVSWFYSIFLDELPFFCLKRIRE